jgi:regulator of protease activity HflC (stomatin/prohibitin superfamily)
MSIETLLELVRSLGVPAVVLIVVLLALIIFRPLRIAQEFERVVIFSFGRVTRRPRGPGWYVVWPWERAVKVDIRIVTLPIQSQDCITADNVTVRVDAVAYFLIVDPNRVLVAVRDYMQATLQIAQTTLRSVIGQVELDELLMHRDKVNERIQMIIDEHSSQWGVKVSLVEVKDLGLPESMQRAMARQAEAEREKRAKIIHAQGELQAAQELAQAAALISQDPAALQLRYLQTLTEIAVEKNSTIVFPMPIDLVETFMTMTEAARARRDGQGQ